MTGKNQRTAKFFHPSSKNPKILIIRHFRRAALRPKFCRP